MDAHTIKFRIDNESYLSLTVPNRLDLILPVDCVDITYVRDNKPLYLVHNFWIEDALRSFIRVLEKAIHNNLQLHESIKEDIGYIWNQDIQDRIEVANEPNAECVTWVGMRYHIFSAPGIKTWLYNSKNGEIIFEITPSYLWHFRDPIEGENFIDYDEFIGNYKPLLIITISKETSSEWLEEARKLLSVIYENERQSIKEAKEQSS